ncbi:MAG: MFS transporter [Synergistaceae bacterium]|nr:MFS transporter [Synergistaceae bacterium]
MQDKKLYRACFYAFFYGGIVMITIGAALPDIRASYNLTDTMSGALLSCYSLGNLASGIIIGFASLYLGHKPAILIFSGLLCLGLAMLAFTSLPVMLFTACALTGLGRGSIITFSQRTVNIFTNGDPKTTGLLHATFAVGAILSPLIFSFMRLISWRAGIILVMLLGFVAVFMFMSVKDYSCLEVHDSDSNSESESHTEKSFAFLHDKGFVIIACLMFLYLCSEFAVSGWLVTYMHHKNMTLGYAHSMASLLWFVMLAGRLICARLVKYISQRKILPVLALCSALSFAFMLISHGEVPVALSVACVGFFMSGISPMIYASSAPYTNKFPLAMGILFTIGCMGGTIMPLITGVIAEFYGFDGGMSAILATFALLIVFAVINIRRTNA